MKSEHDKQTDKIFRIFQSAIDVGQEQRARFLESACADDAELRREVEALLAYDEKAEGFIESPAIEEAAALMEDDKIKTLVGEAIGPFKIISRLGSGGMGEVYLAEDSRLGRKVALKLLDRSLIGDGQSRTRFLREARLASALDHPNICTIHEIGESAGLLFIAMQYVEGKTLKQMIAGRPLSLDSLLSISLQVAGGLAAAHAQGIIHRDIKSNNIIITPRGQVKVLDFGLARPIKKEGHQPELTRTGAVMGTPAYMSPEQARGERADRRSDIFSVGVVMYEMATGRTPFKGKSQPETMSAVINQPHRPIEEINKDVPLEACMVIDRALAKQPSDRHQSIEEMTGDLRRVAQAIGLVGSHSSDPFMVPYVAPKQSWTGWLKQRLGGTARWAALSASLGALLVGLALLVYYLWFSHAVATTEIKSIAVLPFKSLVAANRDEPLELGMADALISKLSGSGDVTVRPLSAIRKFSLVEQDTVAAGRELGVDSVLDGSIQTSGDRIRVSAKLLRTSDGKQLWSEQFDEKFTDIFSMQDSISGRVASALRTRLGSSEKKHSTENVEAYQLYMKGRYHLSKLKPSEFQTAISYFQQAIETDPSYALAYTWLSESYGVLAISGEMPSTQVLPKAKAAAQKAIEIDDTLADAHTSLAANIFLYDWDWSASENQFRRALELDPNSAHSHMNYAQLLSSTGRHAEALAEGKRARELDPAELVINALEGQLLLHAGRIDEALDRLQKTSELEPNFWMAHFFASSAYIEKGMYAEAIAEARKDKELSGAITIPFGAYALAKSGKRAEARMVLEELLKLSATRYVPAYNIALIHNGLGERDEALTWLERGVEQRDPKMTFLKVEPKWNNLRDDPRFQVLLRRVGLAP